MTALGATGSNFLLYIRSIHLCQKLISPAYHFLLKIILGPLKDHCKRFYKRIKQNIIFNTILRTKKINE